MLDKHIEQLGQLVAQKQSETVTLTNLYVDKTVEEVRAEIVEQRKGVMGELDAVIELIGTTNDVTAAELDAKVKALAATLKDQEVFEGMIEARLKELKDGEPGLDGNDGRDGTDGLDKPLIEPVDLVADKDYEKNVLGLHNGGLWISSKKAVGNPDDDPHAWDCILDSMTEMSIDLQDDHTYKLTTRMATGKMIEDTFDIPFPKGKGIWEEGEYKTGEIVTKGHSLWQAMEDTNGCPPGNGWQQILTAPKGPRGAEGKSITGPQGKPGRNGTDAKLPDGFIEEVRQLASQSKAFEDDRSAAYAITSFRGYFSSSESYRVGDLVNFDGGVYLCIRSGSYRNVASDAWELILNVPKHVMPAFMDYQGAWTQKTYKGGDVVVDGEWTMCALTQTTERAGPQPTGVASYLYDGTLTPFSTSTKTLTFGNRYTFPIGGYINGYRVSTVATYHYVMYLVVDPLNNPVITQLADFVADTTGWVSLNLNSAIARAGDQFDLVAYVNEPAGTPTTFSGNWAYNTPPNPSAPGSGEIQQANSTLSVISISKTDDDGGDRSTELEALTVGDTISSVANWTILSVADQGTYIDFGVNPAVQAGSDGVREFVFETVVATPIDVDRDIDYWLNNDNVSGLFDADGVYEQLEVNDNAYGVDLLVQEASVSDDWGFVARSTVNQTSVAAGALTAEERLWISSNSSPLSQGEVITSGNAWTELARIKIADGTAIKNSFSVDAKRVDGLGYHTSEWASLSWNDNGILTTNLQKDLELGTDLSVKLDVDGDEMVAMVKGKPNQDWHWKIISYYREFH